MSESQTPRTDMFFSQPFDGTKEDVEEVKSFAGRLETELTATRARLAKIEEAARADEADLEKMRDGTKLTRAGVVMALQFLQDENKDLRARLAELEGIAERLYAMLGGDSFFAGRNAAIEAYEAYKKGKK